MNPNFFARKARGAKYRATKAYRAAMKSLGYHPDDDFWRFKAELASVKDEDRNRSDLHRLFYAHDGLAVMKWKNYIDVYDRYLHRFRDKPVRILELGVQFGGSLELWRKYFGSPAIIFGIDINPQCEQFNGRSGQIRIGSQEDHVFLARVAAEMGGVDVVIDDGSHIAHHQLSSFEILFPLLAENGVYICEDLHTAYWPSFGGGFRRDGTFIEYAKTLLDDMHSDFHVKKPRTDASRTIDAVHIHNSIVVIEKRKQERPSHFMVGTTESR